MFKCVVEMYGLPDEITELTAVTLELDDGATLADMVNALRREIPALEGDVIQAGENLPTEEYAFNINGQFYFNDTELELKHDDRMTLLLLATGR